MDVFSQLWSASEIAVTVPPASVHPVSPTPRPRATSADAHVRRMGGTDALDGRSAASLPPGRWVEDGRVALDPDDRSLALLSTADRLVLSSEGPWAIFDHGLGRVGAGMRAGGDVTVDPEHGLLYATDPSGCLGAHHLADGGRAFAIPLMLGLEWERGYVARRGQRVIVLSRERPLDPHAHVPRLRCMIEACDVGDPEVVGPDGFLESAVGAGDLVRTTPVLLAACRDRSIVLATTDRLYGLDLELTIEAAVEGAFTPVAMSLDEARRVHLVCSTPRGPAYWAIGLDGGRTVEAPLRATFAGTPFPPLVAHDHHVFVLARGGIAAFDPGGALRWERYDLGPIAGGLVTADDRLLVSAGERLLALRPDGTGEVLQGVGEALWTGPVLTPEGVLFVATRHQLLRLVPEGRAR